MSMPILMIKEVYQEIIKNKFIGAASRAIKLVSDCLHCYDFNYDHLCGTPNEVNPEDVIEIFGDYSSLLPNDILKLTVGIENCSCKKEGCLGSGSYLDNYGSLIVCLKSIYLKILEGTEVICLGHETDNDCISDSFLFKDEGILYSISFEVMQNGENCNFINTIIVAYNANHSVAAEEYHNVLERYHSIAEDFYIENYFI